MTADPARPVDHRDQPRDERHSHAVALAFEGHPYGLLVVTRDGSVIAHNRAARTLLEAPGNELDQPGGGAADDVVARLRGHAPGSLPLVERALASDRPLPEVRIDLPGGSAVGAAWVTVARLNGDRDAVLVELRPGLRDDRRRRTEPYWVHGPQLRISVLGRTRVESAEASIGGRWLDQRTGEVLKYLVTERHRPAYPDEIAEHLWPHSGARTLQGVRYLIHKLRDHLEPQRPPRVESSFVRFSDGRYSLNRGRVRIDADEFEEAITAGRAALAARDREPARVHFARAIDLYQGDFLADEPYAEWAMSERTRLTALQAEALGELSAMARDDGDLESAAALLERLSTLDPFDVDIHRQLIELCLSRHRRSEAFRRYHELRHRLLSTFGEDLGFTLADLAAPADAPDTRLRVIES